MKTKYFFYLYFMLSLISPVLHELYFSVLLDLRYLIYDIVNWEVS